VAQSVWDRHEPWTFDDLGELPGEGWRYEIADGVLQVSAAPGGRHEFVSALLRHQLQSALMPASIVLGPVNLDLGPDHREPDLVVVDRDCPTYVRFPPEVVHLAIEVVSPSSRSIDRLVKPAEYAAAGIPAYWRVETDDVVAVTAYALRDGDAAYTEVGTWHEGETLEVAQPFALRVAVDELVP
jgi:Uma2 family endonuclease